MSFFSPTPHQPDQPHHRGYGPNSRFTLAQTVDVLQSMVITSLDSGDTGQLRDDLTRLCGVFGCADSLYKLAMVAFGMPNGQDIPKEASLERVTWKDVFQKACVEDKKLREGKGWMRNGLLHRLKDFEKFQLDTAARRLNALGNPVLEWLVTQMGGNAEYAHTPLTKYTMKGLRDWIKQQPTESRYVHTEYGAIAEWDVADVDDMSYLFFDARRFNGDLSRWDVSNVTDMRNMFAGATDFNGDLSRWDVSIVNNMLSMFASARSFKGDLSRWDVSIVKNMGHMFDDATSFNGDLSRWNVSNVNIMSHMFTNATSFNSDLSRWNVSNVNNMNAMFYRARSFNSDLSRWNVSSVNDTSFMFYRATSFNGDFSLSDGSQAIGPAPSVHGEPENLFDPTQFPPLPNRLPKLPELPELPKLPELT